MPAQELKEAASPACGTNVEFQGTWERNLSTDLPQRSSIGAAASSAQAPPPSSAPSTSALQECGQRGDGAAIRCWTLRRRSCRFTSTAT